MLAEHEHHSGGVGRTKTHSSVGKVLADFSYIEVNSRAWIHRAVGKILSHRDVVART